MSNEHTKRAFITGITGQDGSYLAELLLAKGYEVHGLVRRSSATFKEKIEQELLARQAGSLMLHHGDLTDANNLARLMERIQPDEIYNLGAQSHVGVSFEVPVYTADVVAGGALRLLDAIRETQMRVKFYQASSSEMFGNALQAPQNEQTPFAPLSPYAIAKLAAFHYTRNYRDAYGMFACNGILFNHESPRRGENFVTRKITSSIAEILAGKRDKIFMGNLDAQRDWGYAPEYVAAMWAMLQQEQPDDYVIATGENHSVREFLAEAFGLVGIDDWERYVVIEARYHRPAEVHVLVGDATKAREKFGWEPKTRFKNLVRIMLKADLDRQGVGHLLA